MKKQFKETGPNGTFTGYVEVLLNQKCTKDVYNPSTHDTDKRTVLVHTVKAVVNGNNSAELSAQTDKDLQRHISGAEALVSRSLKAQANAAREESTLYYYLKEQGYE